MKEATGELNMTLVVVTIVGLLSLLFFTVIWPMIQNNFRHTASCNDAICTCPRRDAHGKCLVPEGGQVECYVKGHPEEKITCTWKG